HRVYTLSLHDALPISGLDVAGQADPAQLALGFARRAPRGEVGVVGEPQRLVQRRLIVAGVVLQRDRRLIGEGVLGDEVPAPQVRSEGTRLNSSHVKIS